MNGVRTALANTIAIFAVVFLTIITAIILWLLPEKEVADIEKEFMS